MKKGLVLFTALIIVLAGFWFYNNSQKSTPKIIESPAATVVTNDIPNLPLTTTTGQQLTAKSLSGKLILVFFQPDCDHCQRETVQIRENLAAFSNYSLYFVSDAAIPQIEQFAKDYKLANLPNITFAHTTVADVINTLGPIQAPSLYIYSENGKLVKSFIGETPITSILPFI